jgi:rhodanese-related sulfurtransferase
MATPKRLTPQQVYERLQASGVSLILVDVRTSREWQREGHIEGAVLIPVDDLQARAANELSKDAEIIVYCHSGVRSHAAAHFLVQMGYLSVADLSGGFEGWQRNHLPVIRD